MQLGIAGNYHTEFAVASHPVRKPTARLSAPELAAWAENSVSIDVSRNGQPVQWIFADTP